MRRIINSINNYFRVNDLIDNFDRVVYNCNCSAPKDGKKKHYKNCRSWLNKAVKEKLDK